MEYCNIYMIQCEELYKIYIGSTIRSLKYRLSQHKSYLDCTSKEIIKLGNYDIQLLLICNIKDRYIHENWFINNYECVNKQIPLQKTKDRKKQYYLDNKEKINIQHRLYHKKNKEIINKRKREKQYKEINIYKI